MNIFVELSIIVFSTTIITAIARILKQPLVVGYILSGIIIGPFALDFLHSKHELELFSKIGISILLFIVGLTLNPDTIKETGKISLVAGLAQVIFTSLIGFGIMHALGFGFVPSIYGAIALTLSSTIIILKILSDKGDLNKLYGKITIGILLVQDLVATLALILVATFGSDMAAINGGIGITLGILLGKGVIAAIVLYIISKYILPRLSAYLATSQELLFLFSLSWGLGMASLFYYIGFSIEIGALIAGVTLSVSSYAYEISSRMKPLRDFFIVLFFVLLGSQVILSDIPALLTPALILSAFVLIGNPLIVIIIMNLLGYRTRTGFMTGLAIAQISEFSLILMTVGFGMGHINQMVVSLITIVGIITIAGSTYLMMYSDFLYKIFKKPLKLLEWRHKLKPEPRAHADKIDMIIFGYDRVGFDFVHAAQKLGISYMVVDFNPTSIKKLQAADIPFRYGDAEDVEFLQEIGLGDAKIIVSTIPDFKTNKTLVTYYRRTNTEGIIMVLSHEISQARTLYLEGATYVVMPHYLGAHRASTMITDYAFDIGKFEKERNKHLAHLSKREEMAALIK